MPVICPTVTAFDPHDYRTQMERLAPFAERVHIDFMDGVFTPTTSPGLKQAWWLKTVLADLHIMYKNPTRYIDQILDLQPHMVIVHAEADGDFLDLAEKLRANNIKTGVALLADTPVEKIKLSLPSIDHVLIFSGDLGHFGGSVELSLLDKADQIKSQKPDIEIGWDGGINDNNAKKLVDGGVDVLNVGGFIQKSKDPQSAYGKLKALLETVSDHDTKNDVRRT